MQDAVNAGARLVVEVGLVMRSARVMLHLPDHVGIVVASCLEPAIGVVDVGASDLQMP